MPSRTLPVVIAATLLGMLTNAPASDLGEALSGTVLKGEGVTVRINEDGTLGGFVQGTWEIANETGKFCRTITAPFYVAGTECQDVSIDGSTAQFTTESGSVMVFEIQ
ncbi:MAG: hypothetical protein AAGH60_03685 [Pseudomonadota bacterium]